MSALRRIFGLGPGRQAQRPSFIEFEAPDGSARLRYVEDTSASAVAARHNFGMIYGTDNLPRNFAMRGVIEVPDGKGSWTPVSGTDNFVPDLTAQLAFLQSYRETGQIGVQAVQDNGSMTTNTNTPGEAAGGTATGGAVQFPDIRPQARPEGLGQVQPEPAASRALSPEQQSLLESMPSVLRALPEEARRKRTEKTLDDIMKRIMPDDPNNQPAQRQGPNPVPQIQPPQQPKAETRDDFLQRNPRYAQPGLLRFF